MSKVRAANAGGQARSGDKIHMLQPELHSGVAQLRPGTAK